MASKKKDAPGLARKEEKEHKDLDHDNEKGESMAHKKKVLGPSPSSKKIKKMCPSCSTMPCTCIKK